MLENLAGAGTPQKLTLQLLKVSHCTAGPGFQELQHVLCNEVANFRNLPCCRLEHGAVKTSGHGPVKFHRPHFESFGVCRSEEQPVAKACVITLSPRKLSGCNAIPTKAHAVCSHKSILKGDFCVQKGSVTLDASPSLPLLQPMHKVTASQAAEEEEPGQ